MSDSEFIAATVEFVKAELRDAEAGHDWSHIERVWKTARLIAAEENVRLFIVELGALLHDIADAKFHDGNEDIGPQKAAAFLNDLGADEQTITEVLQIIRHISFKGGNFEAAYHSPELAVVQDADRLDALGAIGIARCFHYGGFRNRAIYDPSIPPQMDMSREDYKKSNAPTINHFYEKLLRLKDRMHTLSGRRMAEERHAFMEAFLQQFYKEVERGIN